MDAPVVVVGQEVGNGRLLEQGQEKGHSKLVGDEVCVAVDKGSKPNVERCPGCPQPS